MSDRPDSTEAGLVGDEPEDDDQDPYAPEFEQDPLEERLARTVDAARLPLEWAGRCWSAVALPFEYLLALRHAFAEARSMQSPDRRLSDLLLALPAAAAFVAGAAFVAAGVVQGGGLTAKYQTAAAEAEVRGDDEAVRVYAGRAFDLRGEAQSLYRVAAATERLGEPDEAERLMRRLADRHGYSPSHLWLAERSLDDPSTLRDASRLAEVIRRLRLAEAAGGDAKHLAAPMARALLASGEVARAVPYLERAASADPALQVDLAATYARLGRTEEAKAAAVAAEAELRRRVEADVADHEVRGRWAACLLNLGRSQEAIVGLEGVGREVLAKDPVLGDLFALACLARERQLAGQSATAGRRLSCLRRALEIRPRFESVLLRLIALVESPEEGALAIEADRLLDEALAGGGVSPAVSVALGTRAWKAGDLEGALSRLEAAYAADPWNVVGANNLAWLLARGDDRDLARALEIAEDLVKRHPEVAQFRDTRGQILAKAGRWDEALVDLERALGGMRDSVEMRRTLAEAYRRAGRTSLADLQDREADRLEAANAGSTPSATP